MTRRSIRFQIVPAMVFAALIAGSAIQALAGGYAITVHTEQSTTGKAGGETVLVVRSVGCFQPQDAVVTAEAVGFVDGKRQSVSLTMEPVEAGVYQIARQWPSTGAWVIKITGESHGLVSSALIRLGAGGAIPKIAEGVENPGTVQMVRHKISVQEIDTALHGISQNDQSPGSKAPWKPVTASAGVLGLIFAVVAFGRRTMRG